MIARVAIETTVGRLFDYRVPETLYDRVAPGVRVRVPFGNRVTTGFVVEVDRTDTTNRTDLLLEAAPARALKEILAIEGEHPFLTEPLLRLIRWLADYYCAPLEMAIRSALPAPVRATGARAREQLFVSLAKVDKKASKTLTKRQSEVLAEIRRLEGGWMHLLCKELKCTPLVLRKLAEAGVLPGFGFVPVEMVGCIVHLVFLTRFSRSISPAQFSCSIHEWVRRRHGSTN